MKSAYEVREVEKIVKDKTVILVDDIVTTGSSMAACARLAFSMGAYDVMGICIGLTQKEKNIYKNKRRND
jgi:predicted amidophosphoribosyltransferase